MESEMVLPGMESKMVLPGIIDYSSSVILGKYKTMMISEKILTWRHILQPPAELQAENVST